MRRKRASRLIALALTLSVSLLTAAPATADHRDSDDLYTPPPSRGVWTRSRSCGAAANGSKHS